MNAQNILPFFAYLIEYIPLQQGLRHHNFIERSKMYILIEYIPLQQGLRPVVCFTDMFALALIEYIPLQQGLRHQQLT